MYVSYKLPVATILWSLFGMLLSVETLNQPLSVVVSGLLLNLAGYSVLFGIRLTQLRRLNRLNKEVDSLRDRVATGHTEFHHLWVPRALGWEVLLPLRKRADSLSTESIESILHHGSLVDSYEEEVARLEQEVADGVRRLTELTSLTQNVRQWRAVWAEEQLVIAESCFFLMDRLPTRSQHPEVADVRACCTRVQSEFPAIYQAVQGLVGAAQAGEAEWASVERYFSLVSYVLRGVARYSPSQEE
jgi:hypothetical protein